MNLTGYKSIFFIIFGVISLSILAYISSISFNLTTLDMYIYIGLGILSIIVMLIGAYSFVLNGGIK
jgi:hypothetical protein